ncbi:hypothetical protein LguiA_015656 [Lonicera macranthoides]
MSMHRGNKDSNLTVNPASVFMQVNNAVVNGLIIDIEAFRAFKLGGGIFIHNKRVKAELENVENLTEEKIDEILQWFLRDLKGNKLKGNGWPITISAYKVSKAAINAYTRVIARRFSNIIVNCEHPG